VQARPDTAAYVVAKFVRRHRGSVLAGLLVAFGLIATSSFAGFQLYEARDERDVAVAEAKLADAEADLTQFLGGDTLSKGPQEKVHERLDRAREFATRRFRDDLPLAARLLITDCRGKNSLGGLETHVRSGCPPPIRFDVHRSACQQIN
jgi:hypothetical protein